MVSHLNSQITDRASPGENRRDQALAVAVQNSEYALDWVALAGEDRLDYNRPEQLLVTVEDCQQQVFLALEVVVEAAAVDLGFLQDFRDTGALITLDPKQLSGSVNEAIAGWRTFFGYSH